MAAATHSERISPGVTAGQPGLTARDLQQLKDHDPEKKLNDKPKAYLNYVFFDKQLNFVEQGSGIRQVDGEAGALETLSSGKVVARQNGYVYVFTSNESQQDVLFDNLGVTQITGPVLEETHYYPFGLTMAKISTTAPLKIEAKKKFNGIEFNHREFSDGSGLDLYTAKFRGLDPQIGRWWQIDPKATEFESPYVAMSNNTIRYSDPLRDTIIDDQIRNSKVWNPAYQVWLKSNTGKHFVKLFGKGGKFESITVNFNVGKTPEGLMRADANTGVYLVDKKTGALTKLASNHIYKGISPIAKGENRSQYLRFDITIDNTMHERQRPIFTIENAETILHETQHVRIDRQTLQTNEAMQFPYYQHQDWMKPTTSS